MGWVLGLGWGLSGWGQGCTLVACMGLPRVLIRIPLLAISFYLCRMNSLAQRRGSLRSLSDG